MGVCAKEELDPEYMEGDFEESECDPGQSSADKSTKKQKNMKMELSKYIGKDLLSLGKPLLEKKNVLAVCTESDRRRREKSNIWECIINHIHNSTGEGKLTNRGQH